MAMNRHWFCWLGLLALAALSCPLWAETTQSPRDLVKSSTEGLIAALRQHRQEIKTDRQLAKSIAETHVVPHIDFDEVNRLVLGRHWTAASEQQRALFTDVFRRFLMSVYVTAMVTYTDQIIANSRNIYFPAMNLDPGASAAMVRMLIDLPSGLKVEAQFRMQRTNDGWKISDVTVLGVSIAMIYRSMFAMDVARDGLDALIAQLEAKLRR